MEHLDAVAVTMASVVYAHLRHRNADSPDPADQPMADRRRLSHVRKRVSARPAPGSTLARLALGLEVGLLVASAIRD